MTEAATGGTRVRMIPATVRRYAAARPLTERLRVAAYARVSTDDEEQQTSYEAQVDYYTKKIRENPEWIFVEVYADEGITGTSTKRRKNFNRMIDDAMAGRIDRIITKSVSRFARNTVDTLTTVRKLKEKGVGVTFEKENIDTLDSKGELFITIMSSLAQEESRSISENVTWGWRKRIADGKVSVAYSHFLGYEKGPDGNMQIVEEEGVEFIRLQFTDMFGTLKNVAVPVSCLEKAMDDRCTIDLASLNGFAKEEETELYLKPDFSTFTILPWRPQNGKVARFLCDVCTEDGSEYELSPRLILKRALEKAEKQGYTLEVNPECEFFLFHTDDDGMPTTVSHERAGYLDTSPGREYKKGHYSDTGGDGISDYIFSS